MGFLKLAGKETKVYKHKDAEGVEDEDFLEVKDTLSKKTVNSIIKSLPQSLMNEMAEGKTSFTFAEAQETTESLFRALVVGWSLPVEPTLENYLELDNIAAQWVDSTLYEHFNSIQLSKAEQGKP